ncbi:MAG: hypothetical protein ACKOJF_26520, partial [Planctomycetaceae bacterium]
LDASARLSPRPVRHATFRRVKSRSSPAPGSTGNWQQRLHGIADGTFPTPMRQRADLALVRPGASR